MANKVIKDSIHSSKSLARCSLEADLAWARLLLLGDDWGCFEADPELIVSRCFPRRKDITEEMVGAWLREYEGSGQLFRWQNGDRLYGYFVNNSKHNSEYRSRWHKRKTPEPPENLLRKYLENHSIPFKDIQDGSILFKLSTNPNPNPNHTPKKESASQNPPERSRAKPGGDKTSNPASPSPPGVPEWTQECFTLATRIIENATRLDAPKVGFNKDTPQQRQKRIEESAEQIYKLVSITFEKWDPGKAMAYVTRIWDWVLSRPETEGFMWKNNIRSGKTFRYHLDSQLRGGKKKPGGELLRQFRQSPEFKRIIDAERDRRALARIQALAKLNREKEDEAIKKDRTQEAELTRLYSEKDKKPWASKLLEYMGLTLEKAEQDPIMSQMPRVAEAIKILRG